MIPLAVTAVMFGLVPPVMMSVSVFRDIREQLSYFRHGPYQARVWEAIGCLGLCVIWLVILLLIAVKRSRTLP